MGVNVVEEIMVHFPNNEIINNVLHKMTRQAKDIDFNGMDFADAVGHMTFRQSLIKAQSEAIKSAIYLERAILEMDVAAKQGNRING